MRKLFRKSFRKHSQDAIIWYLTSCSVLSGVIDVNPRDLFKVRLLLSKKIYFSCFDEGPLKIMKNAFYSILKTLFVLKVFKILSLPFGHIEKTA